nr:type II secretion system protein N [Gammaproteobacteria bacterium]
MSPGRWALVAGLLTYLVALAAQTPATWAWHRLSGASAEWGLAGVHGTAWSGGAAELRYRGRALGALRWDARPLALLLGRAEARLRLAAGGHSLV